MGTTNTTLSVNKNAKMNNSKCHYCEVALCSLIQSDEAESGGWGT